MGSICGGGDGFCLGFWSFTDCRTLRGAALEAVGRVITLISFKNRMDFEIFFYPTASGTCISANETVVSLVYVQ
jgi:hypothetical protein